MRLNRSMWRAVLAVLLVVLPLTALVVVPATGAADPVLYSQIGYTPVGIDESADHAAPLDSSDAMTADDFVVPADAKWQITQVDVRGTTLDANQPTSFNVFIYTDVVSAGVHDPGVQIFSATGLAYLQSSFNYSIVLPSGPTLAEGTYWLVVQAYAASGEDWGWSGRPNAGDLADEFVGTVAQYVNPGGAIVPTCTTGWHGRGACHSQRDGDQLFALYGLALSNQPPVNTVPAAQGPVNDNANLTFSAANGNAISTTDPDAGGANVQVSLAVSHGTLTLGSTVGINLNCGGACGGNGTASVIFRGTLSEVNNALNGLVYNPADGYGGPDTLMITTNDRGNTGPGGAMSDTDTVAIVVKARTAVSNVSGSVQYGDTNATLSACLATVVANGADVSGQTVTFKFDGTTVATGTTNAGGCATATGANPGLNAGTYKNRVTAEFAGSTYLLPSSGSGKLTVARRLLYVKPVDQTVRLKQPNPTGCTLELANGSTFANGDGWASVTTTNLRCTNTRNYPSSNASETVGKTYKISATGAISNNYDLRYVQGTLTVVP